MARRTRQRRLLGPLLAIALAAASSTAHAAQQQATGRSTDRGVQIAIDRFIPGARATAPGTAAATGTTAGRRCSLFPWIFEPGTTKGGIAPTPSHRRFLVSCDDVVLGTTWIGPADPLAEVAARAVDVAAVAERVLRDIPVGDITIGRRPGARTVTGLPVFAWVDGYDGRPIAETVHELGVTVDVRIALRGVAWDFGDGTPTVVAGLGEAWPRRSSVRHVYVSSTPPGRPATVSATLTLAAEYRVDGGPWLALAPITRSSSAPLEVDQVQAVRRR